MQISRRSMSWPFAIPGCECRCTGDALAVIAHGSAWHPVSMHTLWYPKKPPEEWVAGGGRQRCIKEGYASMQVYEFQDASSGMLCIGRPPIGVSAASLLASALSWTLGSPMRLPLEPLLGCSPENLLTLQHTLFGSGIGPCE